jgi:Phospholipase_D-nuclease N-terminal
MTAPEHDKRRLRDLSEPQRAVIAVLVALQLGLLAAALFDLSRRPARKVRGDKRLWVAASFVNYVGPVAYFAYGRKR